VSDISPEILQQVRELLPWYVNGTLGVAERADVERTLLQSAALQAEVDWLASIHGQLQRQGEQQVEAPRHAAGEAAGLHNLLALVRAESRQPASVSRQPAITRTAKSVGLGWRAWIQPLFYLAALLVVVQAIVIGVLVERLNDNRLAPASGTAAATSGVLLQVVFREATTEKALRAALASAGVEIVGGPGQLGVYLVRAEPEKADAALTTLRRDAVVESATRITP
jgi:hypothetical protein